MLDILGLVGLFSVVLNVLATSQTIFSSNDDGREQWTTFPHPIRRVAVIGAGPAGLQAAAHLLSSNLSVRLFERAPSPGGNWFYTEATPTREPYPSSNAGNVPDDLPAINYYSEGDDNISLDERWREHWQPRPVWSDLVIVEPSVDMEFPGVEYPAGTNSVGINSHGSPPFTTSRGTSGPLHRLDINDAPRSSSDPAITSYATRVERLEKCNLLPESNRIREDFWQEDFDAVVVATGHFPIAHVPVIEGIEDWSRATLDGEWSEAISCPVLPASRALFWKTVLIVGASVTATDIARRISPFVRRLIVCARGSKPPRHSPFLSSHVSVNSIRDAYDLDILSRWPSNAELVPEIAAFQPLILHSAGISDGEIRLVNGTVLYGIDEITKQKLPFKILSTWEYNSSLWTKKNTKIISSLSPGPKSKHQIRKSKPVLEYFLSVKISSSPVVHPARFDNFTGRVITSMIPRWRTQPHAKHVTAVSSPWRHGRYQSAAFAKVWAGTARLPSPARMWEDYSTGKYGFGDVLDIFSQEVTGTK
ncbi:hypothetical protein B0H17DRAFT_1144309 [Mycena rosella]|uniref:FAD/NAD(P)-binding domain-containing protein n=1 Tax=Mycena rosella TaxID=1033263 RepID=A0AAD7G3I8_MYCRO|nr:hypothetical protein B0H17DRAFT_1144309 [Mycena rosella]